MKKLLIILIFMTSTAQAGTIYYAGSTNSFYDSSINSSIPSDAVVITKSEHDGLMDAQANGQVIQNNDGQPETVNPPAPSTAQLAETKAIEAITSGLTVTSSSYPALNGTYSLSPNSIANINAITTCILLNSTFCNGGTTMSYADASGTMHTFLNISEFKSFATQFAAFVAAVQTYADSGGTVGSIPSNEVTIP